MPTDPRAEASAQSLARGANLKGACELARFAGAHAHASRFAKRAEVAARVEELIEAGRRPLIAGQDIAFEFQRLVRCFEGFDTPEDVRETRETLMGLCDMRMALEADGGVEHARSCRISLQTAQTSPKPPVSARISCPARRPALAAPTGRMVWSVGGSGAAA